MELSKESIIALLERNDFAVVKAVVALNERQTAEEQCAKDTKVQNGVGFRSCDAFMGTVCSEYFAKNQRMTNGQIAYWKKRSSNGQMKITAYHRQLLEIAQAKAAEKAAKEARVSEAVVE